MQTGWRCSRGQQITGIISCDADHFLVRAPNLFYGFSLHEELFASLPRRSWQASENWKERTYFALVSNFALPTSKNAVNAQKKPAETHNNSSREKKGNHYREEGLEM